MLQLSKLVAIAIVVCRVLSVHTYLLRKGENAWDPAEDAFLQFLASLSSLLCVSRKHRCARYTQSNLAVARGKSLLESWGPLFFPTDSHP